MSAASFGVLGAVGALAGAGLLIPAVSGRAEAATVSVTVRGVAPGGGRVFVSLCANGLEPQDCPVGAVAAATGASVTVAFPDVPPGTWAVAAFQDESGTGVLDRTRNGLPLEPYGFSNETGRPGVPRFERAAFRVDGDAAVVVRLQSLAIRR